MEINCEFCYKAMTFHIRYASGKKIDPDRFAKIVKYGHKPSVGSTPYYYEYAEIGIDDLQALSTLPEVLKEPRDRNLIICFNSKGIDEIGLPVTINEIVVYDDYIE